MYMAVNIDGEMLFTIGYDFSVALVCRRARYMVLVKVSEW